MPSATPLSKKLGLKSGFSILLYKEPAYYWNLFLDLPEDLTFLSEPVQEHADFIHLFCTSEKELHDIIPTYKYALKKQGLMWISWPKGSSKISTDLKRDAIRAYVLGLGLVDVKVAAIDKDWSGLKFVYRLEDR